MSQRVWEPFLTAQISVAHRTPASSLGCSKRPALRASISTGGSSAIARLPAQRCASGRDRAEAAWDAIPTCNLLGAAARRNPGLARTSSAGDIRCPNGATGQPPGTGKPEGTKWDIIAEVAPIAGETVLYKLAPSAFFGTLLPAQLNALNVDSLIICGESTSGCVRASCVDARSYRYKVTVVEECVFDRHHAAHAINLFDMHEKYADVLGIDEVVAHLESLHASVAVPA